MNNSVLNQAILDGHIDLSDPSFLNRISVTSVDGHIADQGFPQILGNSLPQLPRGAINAQQLQEQQ